MDDVKRKIRLKWPFLSKNFEKYSSYWTDSALIEKPNVLEVLENIRGIVIKAYVSAWAW